MERKELSEVVEENTKYKYFSIVNKIWVIIITIAIFFIVHKLIDDKNSSIEKLNDEKMELSQKLYEYKKNTLIQNKDALTSYLTQHFKEMKEYRVISLIQSNYIIQSNHIILRVILDEPIKTTENSLGYKKSNWIDVITIIEPGKLEIKDFFPIILKEETKSEPKVVDKNSWLYKIQEFFPNQFSELLIFFSESSVKIDKMITDMNIDSIENPILLVKIDKNDNSVIDSKVSLSSTIEQNEINKYININCNNLKKEKDESNLSYVGRLKSCLVVQYLKGLEDLIPSKNN